jgi:AcrR family transcriptional regulator
MPRQASPSATPPKLGRPRSQHARRAILGAARALVEKSGYPAATIEAIAARSGVAKTTIYRWWPDRPALLVDLLAEISAEEVPPAVGGDPIEAIQTELRLIARAGDALLGRLFSAVLAEAQHDRVVRAALVDRLFNPRRKAMAGVVREAQEIGAIRRDVPAALAVELLVAPLFIRLFVRHQPLTQHFARQVFEEVFEGLAPHPRARDARRRCP